MAKSRRYNQRWLEEAVRDDLYLSICTAFKDACLDGQERVFLEDLTAEVKRQDQFGEPNWRVFFMDTLPLLRDEVKDLLTTQRNYAPPVEPTLTADDMVAQRKLNERRGRRRK